LTFFWGLVVLNCIKITILKLVNACYNSRSVPENSNKAKLLRKFTIIVALFYVFHSGNNPFENLYQQQTRLKRNYLQLFRMKQAIIRPIFGIGYPQIHTYVQIRSKFTEK